MYYLLNSFAWQGLHFIRKTECPFRPTFVAHDPLFRQISPVILEFPAKSRTCP